jgi:AraC family transcriptional regulator
MRRRLSESARELVRSDRKIIDIAYEYQFNNPETYSRAFRRMFAMQPSQWRNRGLIEERRLMPRLSLAYLEHINRGNHLKPVLVEKEALQLAGLMALVEADRAAAEKLWEILAQELERLGIRPEKRYGLTWYPEDTVGESYFYLAGIVLPNVELASSGLVVKSLPGSKYARFIHKGSSKDLPYTLDYIYHTWLPKSGEQLTHPFELEAYHGEIGEWDQEGAERGIYIPIE